MSIRRKALGVVAALSLIVSCSLRSHANLLSEEDESLQDGDIEAAAELHHPSRPTAFATRVLMTTENVPSVANLTKCSDEINAIAKSATNQEMLTRAQMDLTEIASSDLSLYHYCFYAMMIEIDQKLDEGGPVMTDLADEFFARFRGLWILSRALDAVTRQYQYFDYLRKRYVQISKDYFGRDLEIYAAPFRERTPAESAAPMRGKPASRVPQD